ncbi:hypothetical protein TNIN_411751 [Trichonephila inaurata madagascariensis]|uniref:Uncharacterized protein n=1 Tax=Trichonephila inaurata madagascariensis TaxID=2747483 RepID=A0A8X6JSJ6_9ARAC|nr:hypothetical protein TNIN_411751 [Trichonephila inaurata madagascariensis]
MGFRLPCLPENWMTERKPLHPRSLFRMGFAFKHDRPSANLESFDHPFHPCPARKRTGNTVFGEATCRLISDPFRQKQSFERIITVPGM